jgi:hypothetical protein
MKILLKTKVFFAWYLHKRVILTKDNLAKHNWHGNTTCVLCHHDETIKHLFFMCKFAHIPHVVLLIFFLAIGLMGGS